MEVATKPVKVVDPATAPAAAPGVARAGVVEHFLEIHSINQEAS